MIEVKIREYLVNTLNIPVFLEFPSNPPKEFIIFEKTGSGRKEILDTVTIAFQSYSDTMYKASVLNEKLKESVLNMVTLDYIARVELNTDYNYTDTTLKKYRYQAVFDINYY